MVSMRENDTITLSHFSVIQLLAGLSIVTEKNIFDNGALMVVEPINVLRVAGKLYNAAIAPHHIEESQIKLDVNRADVKVMYELLKLRMKHCEEQRDAENQATEPFERKFNPDTYIGQKLLLLELREWLALEAISMPALKRHKVAQEE